jgi:hypothetical protein
VKALQESLTALEGATRTALGKVVECMARRQREDEALGQQLQTAVATCNLEAVRTLLILLDLLDRLTLLTQLTMLILLIMLTILTLFI